MSTLVSILSPREKIKMPPVQVTTTSPAPSSPSKKSALKSYNGDTPHKANSPFYRTPSKKRLKWSTDKKQAQDCLSDTENNKSKSIKSALSSASASSFFHSKPVEIVPPKKNGSPDLEPLTETPPSVAALTKNFEYDGMGNFRDSLQGQRDSSTISEDESIPSTPATPDKSSSNLSHSLRVVQEIVTTERLYVGYLQDIIEGYLGCMRMEDSPVSKENVQDLFMNIEEIYEFNRKFLGDLENSDDDPVEIAYCFVNKEVGFETYTEYCTKYPKSMEVLTECTRQKETAAFLQKIQTNLGHPLPLGSYLLKPVQRILKYHLLLQDIQKHFDKDDDLDGYDTVSDALDAMTGVAKYINEMKRKHEDALHVQEIQSQLSDFEGPDLTTYGNLVLEDSFRMTGTRTDRYLFLFERILLITKKRENGYTCKATLLLSNLMMTEAVPKEPLAFTIIRFDNQKVDYSFLARNAEQKSKWTLELKRLLLESLAASVPIKAKNLILGEKNVDEEENSESDAKKKSFLDARSPSNPRRHSFRGSLTSPAKRADKNNNAKGEDEPKSPDVLSDDEKAVTPGADVTAGDSRITPDTPTTSPPPAESVCLSVEDWERIVVGEPEEISSDRNSSELEDDAFLPAALDRRRSAEDVLTSTKQRRQNDEITMSSRETTSDSDSPDAAHAMSTPWVPKRSSSLKLLEARLSLEKCMSDSDLRGNCEGVAMNHGLVATDSNHDMTKHLDNITDNSKIQRTVREVAKAFQEPITPPVNRPWNSHKTNVSNTTILEGIPENVYKNSKGVNQTLALDELLESIDRDLDETRRTISNAQLLESALRLKKEPNGTGMDFTPEKLTEQRLVERSEVGSRSNETKQTAYSCAEPSEVQSNVDDRDLKAELAAWVRQTTPESVYPVGERLRTCSLDRRRSKKVFEMSYPHKFDRYSAGDFPLVEPEKPNNVYRMARQYSKRISDEKGARGIRSRSRQDRRGTSESMSAESPVKYDKSPRIKIERITKVTFDDSLEENRVIRRRRKPGHSARDQKRASWSFEKSKSDIDGLHRRLKRDRPRSLHEIKPAPQLVEFDGDESVVFPDGLEAGLEPAMLAGMKKDDIVVRGLVRHLVHKFDPDEQSSDTRTHTELL